MSTAQYRRAAVVLLLEKTARAEASSLGQDFLAGMDPFGFWTADYGQQAERANLSETEHALKRGVGTAGGLVGGSLLIPAAIGGVTGTGKGFLETQGGLGKRLSAGLAQGASDAMSPYKKLLNAHEAAKATKRVGDFGGEFSPDELKAITESLGETKVKSIRDAMESFSMGGADAAETAERSLPREVYEKLKGIPQDQWEDYAAQLMQLKATGKLPESVTRPLSQKISPALSSARNQGLASLGVGGGVGGLGAYLQYGKGRESERESSISGRLRKALGMEV